MKIIVFIREFVAVDRIIDHLKLMFVAAKPPPSHVFEQVALTTAIGWQGIIYEYFVIRWGRKSIVF